MKTTIFVIVLITAFLGGVIFLTRGKAEPDNSPTQNTNTNVSFNADTQTITITARGGYQPRETFAKANVPTTLKIITNGTYDCSSTLTIPSIGYRTNLPATGETEVALEPQQPGTTLNGTCAMGMYHFTINFK